MAGVNIGSSVVRRDSRELSRVRTELRGGGWRQTGSIGDNRIVYMENSGFSLTLVDGPTGTLIMPSGPVRGKLFGTSGLEVSSQRLSMTGGGMFSNVDLSTPNLMDGGLFDGSMMNSLTSGGSNSSSDGDDEETKGEPEQPARKNDRSTGFADFV